MINIIKQGNNVVITSDNPNAFNIGNGELSVPLNTIYYVLDDESDFIQFNSTEEGSILFNGTIGNIQVNGTLVTRDNIITQLDSVFNSASGEGGAGVESVNGLTGAVLLKTINGQEITGTGDIEISGGGTSGVEYISTSSVPSEWDTFKGGVKLTTGFTTFDEGDAGYDIFVNGNLSDGSEAGSLWFGIRSTDNTLKLTDGGGRVDLQVNPDNFKTINGESIIGSGDIVISGGEGGTSGVKSIGVGENPSVWDTFYDSVKVYTSWVDLNDDNNPETLDVRVSGSLQDGTAGATTLWFGFTSSDNSINLGDYSSRLDLQVNPDNFKTINGNSIIGSGDIEISGGEGDNGFSNWKTANLETNKNITLSPDGTIGDSEECVVIGNQSSSNGFDGNVIIGAESYANNGYGVAVGKNAKINDYASIAIGTNANAWGEGSVAIGWNKSTDSSNFRTNINDVIKGDYNDYAYIKNDYNQYVRIPTEWIGTQSEYNALGAYYDNVTYNIIEG